MRLICPHCQKSVEISDSAAEQPTPCPTCGQIFTAPALMTGPLTEPLPPPVVVAPPAPPPPVATPAPKPASVGVDRAVTIPFKREVVRWIGPVALIVLFVLTFFPWIASSPGGYQVHGQSAWQMLIGSFTTDISGGDANVHEELLTKNRRSNGWMWVYLLLLIPAVALAVLEIVQEYITFPVPDAIQWIWPKRLPVLAALTVILFIILIGQDYAGFALENTIGAVVETTVLTPTVGEGTALGTRQQETLALKRGRELALFGLRRTGWFRFAVLAHAVAAVAFLIQYWLVRRGKRQPPRLEFHW